MDVVTSTKRKATRKALLTSARDLVFEKGHDRISVQEITIRARVGTGTYYNYFDSKHDIFVAVAQNYQNEASERLAEIRDQIKDPAGLVATTMKYYFYQALDNQDWISFTRCVGLNDMYLEQDAEQCAEDIQRGVKAGRFKVDDIFFTQSLINGMVRHVNHAIQNGNVERNSIEYCIRSVLQMLGLPELVSRALTQTPLPPIAAVKKVRSLKPENVAAAATSMTPSMALSMATKSAGKTAPSVTALSDYSGGRSRY